MADSMIMTALEQPEERCVITHMHLTDTGEAAPGSKILRSSIAPRVSVFPSKNRSCHAAEQQILAVLEREDIHRWSVSMDQVRETIEFVATDLPAYGLKTFWLYPRGSKVRNTLRLSVL